MEGLLHDIRFAMRSLLRSPGFTVVALLTLALGIGANTAMFSITDGVLLRPLPYAQADKLVRVYEANPKQGLQTVALSFPDFEDWRMQSRSFRAMAASLDGSVILTGRGEPTELQSAYITDDFFTVLRVPTQLGRQLMPDDVRQASRTAVISDQVWRTRFSAAPDAIGSSMVLSGQQYTVVGVMPSDFRYPTPVTDIWVPQSVLSELMIGPRARGSRTLDAVARLADGVELEEARADLNRLAARLETEYPDSNAGLNAATVLPLRTTIVGDVNRALLIVLAVVGLILLIGCANLANLLLARGAARSNEVAVRTALGAARWRIVQQLLTESVVLGLLGGVLGLVLAVLGVRTVLALSANTLPRVEEIDVDGRVIAFAFVLALVTGVMFGLLPALRVAHVDPQTNMKGGRGAAARGGNRLRGALVVAQVALAVVLVIGAGLMARSFLELRSTNPGLDPEQVLAVTLQFNVGSFGGGPNMPREIGRRRREMMDRFATVPGVVSAGAINSLPFQKDGWEQIDFTRADGGGPQGQGTFRAARAYVSSTYTRTMGIPLLRGDPLPEGLWAPDAPVPILINETAAKRFWPGQDAVNQIVRGNWGQAVVVGVVGDVRQLGLTEQAPPAAYFPQPAGPRLTTTYMVRTAENPVALIGTIRQSIREVDPEQPIRSIARLSSVMSESIARDRFFTVLYGIFGGLALVLAAVGVYGVLAYSVGQRTGEIGMRMALGARATDVLRMVVGGGMVLVFTGVVLGVLASLLLTRALQSQLHGISATDPLAFVVAPTVLTAVALLACYIPARRAMRIEPVQALRDE